MFSSTHPDRRHRNPPPQSSSKSNSTAPVTWSDNSTSHSTAFSDADWHVLPTHKHRDRRDTLDPPDNRVADTFATTVDDIIRGRKRSKSRPKPRPDRTFVRCDKCDLTFSSVGNLNRHKRVSHQGVRVYCDYKSCKQSFSQAADLTRHRRRVHQCFTKLSPDRGPSTSAAK